jgi:hypothetical protein
MANRKPVNMLCDHFPHYEALIEVMEDLAKKLVRGTKLSAIRPITNLIVR